MPTIEVDGSSVFYGTGGVPWRQGQPFLLFVHGAGGDHSVWALQARALAQHGWNVAAPDLPGHGQSEDRSDLDSIASTAAWLDDFAEACGVESCAVVGHSMGSCTALTLAAADGSRVRALTLLGAGEAMPVNDQLLDDTLHRPLAAQRFITAFGHGRVSHFGGSQAPGIWMLGAGIALLERCKVTVLHRDFVACNAWQGASLAARIGCPSLVVSGSADRMTPGRSGSALADAIPSARHRLLADCGHMMMSEAPREVTTILRSFLDPLRDSITAAAGSGP